MPNTNVQAVLFANTRARPLADLLATTYLSAKAFIQQWVAQGVAAVIPNDATVISDGAAQDGRAPMTNAQVNVLFAHATDLVNYFEGATGSPVNNASMQNYNQCLAVAVNPASKF